MKTKLVLFGILTVAAICAVAKPSTIPVQQADVQAMQAGTDPVPICPSGACEKNDRQHKQ